MKSGREAELDTGQENGVYLNSSREAAALFYSGGPQGASPARIRPRRLLALRSVEPRAQRLHLQRASFERR
jgi:hypothetical protein